MLLEWMCEKNYLDSTLRVSFRADLVGILTLKYITRLNKSISVHR